MKTPALVVVVNVLLLVLAAFSPPATASDADPLQDFCVAMPYNITLNGLTCKPVANVQSSDFASPLLRKPGNFTGKLGSAVNLASALNFPGLNTQGLSVARIDYKPMGINPPHVHPRATEVLFLAEGTLEVGFVTTANANTLFNQTLYAGDLFVFPRGLVHFQFNPDKYKSALAIAALNSQNPGASQVAVALFDANPPISEDVLEATLGVSGDELRNLIASVKGVLMTS